MPSSLTITSFYSFTPYTKARAIHLNANFSNLRGHMLPIDPTSADATDQTYNLGSTDHRWRAGYFQGVSLSISIGASHILYGTTAGGFKFVKDQTTTFQFLSTYYKGHNATPVGPTTTAAKGQWAASAAFNNTLASGFLSGSTCTMSHNGRWCFIGLMQSGDTSASAGIEFSPTTATVSTITAKIIFLEDGNTIGCNEIGISPAVAASTFVATDSLLLFTPGCFGNIFNPNQGLGAGTNNYSIEISNVSTTGYFPIARNLKVVVFELPG